MTVNRNYNTETLKYRTCPFDTPLTYPPTGQYVPLASQKNSIPELQSGRLSETINARNMSLANLHAFTSEVPRQLNVAYAPFNLSIWTKGRDARSLLDASENAGKTAAVFGLVDLRGRVTKRNCAM